jgi:hypothetical protein
LLVLKVIDASIQNNAATSFSNGSWGCSRDCVDDGAHGHVAVAVAVHAHDHVNVDVDLFPSSCTN